MKRSIFFIIAILLSFGFVSCEKEDQKKVCKVKKVKVNVTSESNAASATYDQVIDTTQGKEKTENPDKLRDNAEEARTKFLEGLFSKDSTRSECNGYSFNDKWYKCHEDQESAKERMDGVAFRVIECN